MMEELRDIKGLVEVTDYSLYYLLGVIGVGVIALGLLALLLYRYATKKDPLTQKKMAMELLAKFEFKNAKESAYAFSHLAQYAVNDQQRSELEALLKELEAYKYKKEVPELDAALKTRMQHFIEEHKRG